MVFTLDPISLLKILERHLWTVHMRKIISRTWLSPSFPSNHVFSYCSNFWISYMVHFKVCRGWSESQLLSDSVLDISNSEFSFTPMSFPTSLLTFWIFRCITAWNRHVSNYPQHYCITFFSFNFFWLTFQWPFFASGFRGFRTWEAAGPIGFTRSTRQTVKVLWQDRCLKLEEI